MRDDTFVELISDDLYKSMLELQISDNSDLNPLSDDIFSLFKLLNDYLDETTD